jgi:hypothetical protein
MDDKEFELERKKLQHSREKFWVGGVALVILSSIINYQIQQRELGLKQLEEENRHLSQFVDQIVSKDPQVRVIIAEYFETVSISSDARNRWEAYLKKAKDYVVKERIAEETRITQKARIEDLEARLAKATADAKIGETKKLKEELIPAYAAVAEARKTVKALNPTSRMTCDAYAGAFYDPANGGQCWSCPTGYSRSLAPITSPDACVSGSTRAPANLRGNPL